MENIWDPLCSPHVILAVEGSIFHFLLSFLVVPSTHGWDYHHHSHQVGLLHIHWIISGGILGGCHSENAQQYIPCSLLTVVESSALC